MTEDDVRYRIYSPSHSYIKSKPLATLDEARALFDRYEEHYGDDNVDLMIQKQIWVEA